MNPKRLVATIFAVFASVWVVDFLVHGIWLQSDYRALASVWRSPSDMQAHVGWLTLAQALWSATFVLLWAKGFAGKACIFCGIIYGLLMGLFFQTNTIVLYAVQPLPGFLMVKWFCANIAEGVLAGAITFLVYKPKADTAVV